VIIKIKYEARDNNKHVHARIFMGPDLSQLTMCGSLIFKSSEFDVFNRCLKDGSLLVKGAEVVLVDTADGSSSSFPKVRWTPPES